MATELRYYWLEGSEGNVRYWFAHPGTDEVTCALKDGTQKKSNTKLGTLDAFVTEGLMVRVEAHD